MTVSSSLLGQSALVTGAGEASGALTPLTSRAGRRPLSSTILRAQRRTPSCLRSRLTAGPRRPPMILWLRRLGAKK